jgi:hypothetical protein
MTTAIADHMEELEDEEDIAYIEVHKDDPAVPFGMKDYVSYRCRRKLICWKCR